MQMYCTSQIVVCMKTVLLPQQTQGWMKERKFEEKGRGLDPLICVQTESCTRTHFLSIWNGAG